MSDPRFVGVLSLHPSDDRKFMVLDSDFSFIDSTDLMWTARKGDEVNGANIPKIFKPIIGTSYQNPYLPAAVIHDVYCKSRVRSWKDTARMFYEAMVTNGVNFIKAWVMYSAVYVGGPHW